MDISQKETADTLERERQNKDADSIEQIRFTKQQLYCVAKHLQAYLKLADNDQNFQLPCRFCKFLNSCTKDFQWDIMRELSQKTGVELSIWRGFKIEDIPELSQG